MSCNIQAVAEVAERRQREKEIGETTMKETFSLLNIYIDIKFILWKTVELVRKYRLHPDQLRAQWYLSTAMKVWTPVCCVLQNTISFTVSKNLTWVSKWVSVLF